MINLSEHELRKFAAYCRQESESASGLAKQMEGVPGGAINPIIVKRLKSEAAAFGIVYLKLDSTEIQTIEPPSIPPTDEAGNETDQQ